MRTEFLALRNFKFRDARLLEQLEQLLTLRMSIPRTLRNRCFRSWLRREVAARSASRKPIGPIHKCSRPDVGQIRAMPEGPHARRHCSNEFQ